MKGYATRFAVTFAIESGEFQKIVFVGRTERDAWRQFDLLNESKFEGFGKLYEIEEIGTSLKEKTK